MKLNIKRVNNMLKTITLGPDSGPIVSLCPGHVDAKIFNEAHINEGWDGDEIKEEDLEKEWWKRIRGGGYEKSIKLDMNAKSYTALYW